ncbi:hypothetical protein FPV67DRAFT_1665506 [Lyophyllum atratum]|nr:hypothetical protein FPV67DRAFT_1665506 [Lyophyllum atratum]
MPPNFATSTCLSYSSSPSYYESQASPIHLHIEDGGYIRDDNNTAASARGAYTTPVVAPQIYENTLLETIPLIARPDPAHLDTRSPMLHLPLLVEPLSSASTSTEAGSVLASRNPMAKIQSSWSSYIESRYREWAIVATSACTFAPASPPILQMPGINGYPVGRFFVFLAILRAISAIVYAIILLMYFGRAQSRTVEFALLWFRDVKKNQLSILNMPWTLLALPAVALSWGVIFFILALFCSIWGTRFSPNPSISPPPSDEFREAWADVIFRIIMAATSLLDLACMVRMIRALKAINEEIRNKAPERSVHWN